MLSMFSNLPVSLIGLSMVRLACACASTVPPMMFFILTEVFRLGVFDTGIVMGIATGCLMLGNFFGGKCCSRFNWWYVFVLDQIFFLMSLFLAVLNSTLTGFITCIYLSCLFAGGFLVCFTIGTLSLIGTSDKATALSVGYMFFNMGYAIGVASAGVLFRFSYKWVFYFDCLANFIALTIFIIFIKRPKIDFVCATIHTVSRKARVENNRTRLYLFLMLMVHGGFVFLLPLMLKKNISNVAPAMQYGRLIAFSALATMILSPYLLRVTKNKTTSRNLTIASAFYVASYVLLSFSSLDSSLRFCSAVGLRWNAAFHVR